MWNQASSSSSAAAGGSGSGMPPATSAAFASHARSTSMAANSPSAHRRAGAVGPTQHASPSNNPIFPRPFANVAFPGTVTAPRSTAAPNTASTTPRSLQHLSLLTTRTPTSIAKLDFPPHTTIYWHRFQDKSDETVAAAAAHEHQRQEAAPSWTAASTSSFQEFSKAWHASVQRVLSSASKSRHQPQATDDSQRQDHIPIQLLLKDPLIYTSSKETSSEDASSATPRTSKADLWVFVVVTNENGLGVDMASLDSVATAEVSAAIPSDGADAVKSASQQTCTDATPLSSTLARVVSSDLANSLSRLSTTAHASSGSYRLSAAANHGIDSKGKQSSLTSQERQAHKHFMASIKARLIDSLACPLSPSSGHTQAESKRTRLRLGDSVVFFSSRHSDQRSTATADATWFAAPTQPKVPLGGITNPCCLVTRLDVSLTAKSLFVNARSRRLGVVPLIDSRLAHSSAVLPPSSPHPTMLIAPLGCRVELIGIAPTTAIATEHLSELSSAFAALDPGAQSKATDKGSPFASGVAICAFPRPSSETQSLQQQTDLQDQQQLRQGSLVSSTQAETGDQHMLLPATAAARPGEQASGQEESLHFIWPAAWCLLVPDRGHTSSGSNAIYDLQSMQSQPLTPLKELVSFTLKVLSDANESFLAQSTAPYTPGEPGDVPLTRRHTDRLPSTRPDLTPASISFADFDFAIPTAASGTISQALPAAGQSVPGTSPLKRETTSAEPVQAANSTEAFGQDLNWMQFLPSQSSDGPATSSASAFAMQIDASSAPAPTSGAIAVDTVDARHLHTDQTGSNWLASGGSSSSHQGAETAAAQPSGFEAPQSLLQPHAHMQSQGSTPLQGLESTPLGFAQPTSTKRKAGEGDIFGNLGLLTEDDFSFFDESAFGLDAEGALPQHMDQPAEAMQMADSQDTAYGRRPIAPSLSMAVDPQPATSSAAIVDDVAMDDVGQSSLDALFSAIPGLQDAMASSESSQAQHASLQPMAASTAVTQPVPPRSGHSAAQDVGSATATSMHPFHSAMNSFTPRDASAATPFGDPASLPGFTPSSLTESSPAFGNPHYKTPRTPYSPVEEYRDGATIVDLHNSHRMGDAAQNYRDRHATSAPDLQATDQHPLSGQKADALLQDEQLRLADASTAAAAAANAAMDADGASRKRPAIVPNAFLPLRQAEARKPLQRLPAGARANLGRKYDLLGKFASRPKAAAATATAATMTTALNTSNAPPTTEHLSSGDVLKTADRVDKQGDLDSGRLGTQSQASQFGSGASQLSPSKTPSRRGQALLQLRRDRCGKSSPGFALTNVHRSSSSRTVEGPMTPRSSEDVVMSGAISASDSESSSSGDDDSDAALSDSEATAMTLSPHDQATLKELSLDVVASYLCGAAQVSRKHGTASSSSAVTDQSSEDAPISRRLVTPLPPLSRALPSASIAGTAALSPRPTIRRWMLSRTAEWVVQNPHFRSMYCNRGSGSTAASEIALGDKIEVLEAMASALRIAPVSLSPKQAADTDSAPAGSVAEAALPTLKALVKSSKHMAAVASEGIEVAEVLEPTRIAVGCQGSVVEALPSSLTLWDKSKLSAVSGQKHVVAKVLLTDASPAWHEEIVAWLDRLRVAFESYGLGTHAGDAQSILAVADGSESLALSSCLDQLWNDGETWLDTLRSISSRVELELLQGKHVVVYTLQPPNSAACNSTGFHGLLRLEADLRAMLSEQVGVLAEQLLVRAVSPLMMTESGSLGFGQQSQTLRRLAFSVYDQLPRLVRRQPAKVLHGREPGPISAAVQFPAFSLSTASDARSADLTASKAGRTNLSMSWPHEPAVALDEHVLLHVSYRVCQTGLREQEQSQQARADRGDSNASFDAVNVFGLGSLADGDHTASSSSSAVQESLVMMSAIDERGGSSTVAALGANDGDSSIEACVERVWRFALEEASRARVRWRLAISSAGLISHREVRAWQGMIGTYLASTGVEERVMGSVVLLSVRPDESGAVLSERGGRTKPSQEWAAMKDKASLMVLDAADFSQMVKFAEPMPMGWTQSFSGSETVAKKEEDGDEEEDGGDDNDSTAMPIASAMLVHRSRPDVHSSDGGIDHAHRLDGGHSASLVLAVDMLHKWTWTTAQQTPTPTSTQTQTQGPEVVATEDQTEQEEAMDAILRSLHRLRLISEERHQLPWPYTAQPWSVASVNTLAACLDGIVLSD